MGVVFQFLHALLCTKPPSRNPKSTTVTYGISHVCTGSHTFAIFPPTCYMMGVAMRTHVRDDLYQMRSKFGVWTACLHYVALQCSLAVLCGFSGHLFRLVSACLLHTESRKKRISALGDWEHLGDKLLLLHWHTEWVKTRDLTDNFDSCLSRN